FINNPLILPVQSCSDLEKAQNGGKIAAILTVENLGFTGGDLSVIPDLKKLGVHMASLVWNNANCFAYPNLIFEGGKPLFAAREERGLTALGKDAVRVLNDNKIIVDISHLSDGGVEDVLNISTAPIVASHSNCAAVCGVCRNLTDGQLKKIAESGGVAGLNFCRDFVGGESALESLCLHLKHMIKVGGEDLPALGSDFDGIPPYDELSGCEKVQSLLEYFARSGISPRVLEKVAYGNFARVFGQVVG
ncbi:MAG: dipeptidase, partial [Clostridia bacterium]|nr:dipeptidase [Clostridia bacterium]